MTNFIFNWADAALSATTLDLSTGTYYAHIVTTQPSLTDTTVANLVLTSAAGYTGQLLTNMVYTTQKWSFDNFSFPRYIFATLPPVGMVICKRIGASFASTDPVICYSDFVNAVAQVITGQVGVYVLSQQFMVSGAISFTYRYQYTSGAYAAGTGSGVPFGLIYLMGTANNTVSFANPVPSKIISIATSTVNDLTPTNRIASGGLIDKDLAFDFGARTVKVGDFGYLLGGASSQSVTIYGSNSLPAWNTTELANNSNWTAIASTTAATNNSVGWKLATSSSSTYWRYLRMSTQSAPMYMYEIELYNSTILSPNQNMV
jgi:hypothetical protein